MRTPHKTRLARAAGQALSAGLVGLMLLGADAPPEKEFVPVRYDIRLQTVTSGYDGKTCWVHPRAGAVPWAALPEKNRPEAEGTPMVVLTAQKLLLSGSDVFYGLHTTRNMDWGKTWTDFVAEPTFKRRKEEGGVEAVVCDFTPKWHAATGTLLGTGHIARYKGNALLRENRRRGVSYAVYDLTKNTWKPWKQVEAPDLPQFYNSGAGSTQRVDLEDGTVLLPIYHKGNEDKYYASTVVRCNFDGETLAWAEHGNPLSIEDGRGLYEPSLAKFGDAFYLTLRNDSRGYVAKGTDGILFDEPIVWCFDDGEELGTYNTQQHWVTHPRGKGLFLVYTRKGAKNDHVFRHRAPLFIAQVDPEKCCVLRDTERVLVRERGARLGNFAVAEVSEDETWVTVAEWMQPEGCEEHGSDNSVYAARIVWAD